MENELCADDQKRLRNISMQTGEEFSPTFLKDRVTSRRTPVVNDVDQILTSKPSFDVVQNHHLTAIRSILRRDSESFTDYLDVSPSKGYGFDRGSPSGLSIYSSGSPNSYQFSSRGSGVVDGSFSGKIKFLCSFGGRILPRPNDGNLRYVGGDTRIMSIRKNTTYLELMKNTMAICNYPHTIKYQLPGEDLDALISVSSDEDLHHMIEEYYELEKTSQRLRIFLVSCGDSEQQGDAGCPYVVAVNGMLEPSHPRSFSRESLECQWDSPTPSRLVENQSGGNASNLKLALSSPQVPSKSYKPPPPLSLHNYAKNSPYVMDNPANDNLCHFDASGHYQNNATDALPVVGSPNQKSYLVQQRAIPQVGSHFCQPSKEFQPPLLYAAPNYSGAMRGFPNVVDVVPSQDTFCFSPDIYRRENNFLSEEKSGCAGAEEKSPSIEMSNSSQEEVVEHIAHARYQISRNKDHNYSECASDSTKFRKNSAMCYDQDNKNYALNGSYLEHKNNLPPTCLPESQVNGGKVSSSFNSAENLADLWKGLPGNHQIQPNEPEFLIKSQKESSDLKHLIPNAAILGSHVLHPISTAGNNQTQFISPILLPESSSSLCMKNPSDCREREKNTNGSLGGEVSCQKEMVSDYDEGLVNDSHKKGKKIRPATNYREKFNNCRETRTLEEPVMVELSDEVESPGDKTEAESHLYESGGDDVEVDGESKGESPSEVALMEMKASLHGLQIIRNSDLEDLQELGSGTFGTVYHGKWRGTDVAIKRIKKSCFSGRSSEQEKLTNDFWREAKILSGLHHPNIVAFYGVVPDGPGGTLATVTEYLVNGSLRRVLLRKDRALDPRKKVIIALEAAFGMEYLHLKNIVHFDLKCDNLLVNLGDPQRPVCKVGDFGLSRIKQKTLVSGGVRGTLPWMAPELLNGNSARVSEKVDVFSFGIAMWEILTGEEPYINYHCGEIIGGIVTNSLRPVVPERCDPEWKKLMEECWSHEPEARPSFTEITDRLRVMSKALQPKRFNKVKR